MVNTAAYTQCDNFMFVCVLHPLTSMCLTYRQRSRHTSNYLWKRKLLPLMLQFPAPQCPASKQVMLQLHNPFTTSIMFCTSLKHYLFYFEDRTYITHIFKTDVIRKIFGSKLSEDQENYIMTS